MFWRFGVVGGGDGAGDLDGRSVGRVVEVVGLDLDSVGCVFGCGGVEEGTDGCGGGRADVRWANVD